MISFKTFLFEANSAGSQFEQKIADNIQDWIEKNGLAKNFEASRYQTITENDGNRDEDFSDIVVTNLQTKEKFFIECKKGIKDNCVTTQFDIMSSDYSLIPVSGKNREKIEDDLMNRLASDIQTSEEYQKFCEFMESSQDGIRPADCYFGEIDQSKLDKLISDYNKMVDQGKVEADNKKFDKDNIRDSTRGILGCALLWRLSDESHTWDICHLTDIPYFSDLVKHHYCADKSIPAKYIQLDDMLFKLTDENPLNINAPVLPAELSGQFDLKFTPRFGTGSIYVTPRSKITSDLSSDVSFDNEDKWPSIFEN